MSQLLRSGGTAHHFAILALGLCLLCPFIPCPARASSEPDPFEEARQRHEEAKQLAEMEKAAKAGDVRKMVEAGYQHLHMSGKEQGYQKTYHEQLAAGWFQKASEKGYWAGTEALSDAYRFGWGQPADPARADELEKAAVAALRQKAEAGDEEAGLALGSDYERGRHGLPEDGVEAVKWYRKAADAGGAAAMGRLASLYELGDPVPRDVAEALKWWRKAADAGNRDAMLHLGTLYAEGTGVERSDVEAVTWYRKAADAGNGQAMLLLGLHYDSGRGLGKDGEQAQAWYQRAVEAGESTARELIGTPSRAVVERLKRPLPEVKVNGVGLADVIDFLRDVSGSDIVVYWNALKNQGVEKETPITYSAENVPFSDALNAVLAKAGGKEKITYAVVGDTVAISTQQDLTAQAAGRARRRAAIAQDDDLALKLVRLLPEVKFDGVGVADALDFLKDVSGLSIEVDWDKLAAEHGIGKESPVSVMVKNTSVAAVLDAVVSSAGKGTPAVTFRDGRVHITAGEPPPKPKP